MKTYLEIRIKVKIIAIMRITRRSPIIQPMAIPRVEKQLKVRISLDTKKVSVRI